MLIKDLVKLDTQGWFSTAVQLSDYDNDKSNFALVKSYIFAESAPDVYGTQTRAVGSLDLLRNIRLSLMNNGTNRFVVVANYGHGKSHLGLVLTNYFAKPYQSKEIKEILGRIDQALNNPAKSEDYHEFKRQNDRFLVVRLRGDTPRSLREQFFPALRLAFDENPTTKSIELPFWNQKAKQWLENKLHDPEAKKYLKQYDSDMPTLIQEVEENKDGAYQLYVEIFSHFNNGVPPSAEGNFSLREAIIWAVEQYCGEKKPFSGIVVLFDEFSQFVQRYSQSKAVGDLQDLLQGIGDKRGQAIFLAFAQHDPDEIAEQVQSGQALQGLKRELGRIDRKYALYSLMESVLNAYLAQSPTAWEQFLQADKRIKGRIYGDTTELTWELFTKRYDKELRWTYEKFRSVVTDGCFPLHPLTTALLCHLKMQQGEDIGTARTVLGFVRDQMSFNQNEPAAYEDRVNWILPIALVDYFEGRLVTSLQQYAAYQNAVQNLELTFGDSASENHRSVLKALLLQEADRIAVTGEKQVELIAQMIGADERSVLQILKELSGNNITKYDASIRFNSFWPVTANPQILEQKIREKLEGKRFDDDALLAFNDSLDSILPSSDKISVPIDWGTPEDWAATVKVFTKDILTKEKLREWMQPTRLTFQGLQDGDRGLVGWLLALDETDRLFFRENAAQILKDAFPEETPPPVVLLMPTQPNKALADAFLRQRALKEIGKEKDTLKEIGQNAYDQEVERTKKALLKAFEGLVFDLASYATIQRKSQDLVIPANHRTSIMALHTINLQTVLKRLYELAYPHRPPKFFTELAANPKRGRSPLREAVKTVSKNLIHNRVNGAYPGMDTVGQRICKDYLILSWGILSTTYWIQEPESLLLKNAWEYLENTIKPDEEDISAKDIIETLLRYPYGFDYNTALLLICAWIGRRGNELRLSINGVIKSLEAIEEYIDLERTSPQAILSRFSIQDRLTISRRDVDKALNQGRSIIQSVEKRVSRSQLQAEQDIGVLQEIVVQSNCPQDEKQKASRTIEILSSTLDAARAYDDSTIKILTGIASETDVRKLINYRKQVKELVVDDLVLANQPSASEIQDRIDLRLQEAVESSCKRVLRLNDIEYAGNERKELSILKETLQREGMLDLVERVSIAESNLEERIKALKLKLDEAAVLKQIQMMTSHTNLVTLYEYREILQEIKDGSESLIKSRQQKLDEINRAISELETFASTVTEIVTDIKPQDINSLQERILRYSSRYIGSKYEEVLKKAGKYLSLLRDYIQEINSHKKFNFSTTDEVEEIKTQVNQIRDKYATLLSKNHLAIADQLLAEIDYEVSRLISSTEKWLLSIEGLIETLKFNDAASQLKQSGSFHTPEIDARLDAIQLRISEQEERDIIVKIENLFRSISDPLKREECINRLKKLI